MARRIYWIGADGRQHSSTNVNDLPPLARAFHEIQKLKHIKRLRKIRREREARALELRKNKPKG
jgi:hypothetical protein